MPSAPPEIHDLARAARRVVVLTGAGMSAESGVATFRDAHTGLWARFDPSDLATVAAFRRHPAHVFGWYAWRFAQLSRVEPNAGHLALARWAERAEVRVITQNVDDLHERAGSADVLHLHGSLTEFRCSDCEFVHTGPIPEPDDVEGAVAPPECLACGGLVRPGVVWFGEALPDGAIDTAIEAVRAADLVLVVGTSGLVQPAASLPSYAGARGIPVVEINPEETELSDEVDHVWRTTAAEGLPVLAAPGDRSS